MAERALTAAMDHHPAGEEPGNQVNRYGGKTVVTDTGQIELWRFRATGGATGTFWVAG